MTERTHCVTVGRERWVEQVGEVDLIGGWAEVALADDFASLIDPLDYQVFLTAYDPVQLFVQNRTEHSFEIHAMPGARPATSPLRCGYRAERWTDIGNQNGLADSAMGRNAQSCGTSQRMQFLALAHGSRVR